MALLSNLMVRIGVDPDGVRGGVNKTNRELDRIRDRANGLSRELGVAGTAGGDAFGSGFQRDANGRLHDAEGRFVAEGRSLGTKTGGGFSLGFGNILHKGLTKVAGLLRASSMVAAVGSAAITAFPLVLQLAHGLITLGGAALNASPVLLALGAGALIVKTAFTAMFAEGTAARKALEPLGAALTKARDAGSEAAAKGIRPLAAALAQVAQPVVTGFMTTLGNAANRVQKDFLGWAKSTSGIRTLRSILGPLADLVAGLAPHVSALAIAFVKMLGRVMPVSAAIGKKGLAGAIDWLTQKFNGVNAKTVTSALSTLGNVARTVWTIISTVAGWIGKLVKAYQNHTTAFKTLADAFSIAAIIFGGPVAVIIGVVSLIIRHFDLIKQAWNNLKAAFTSNGGNNPLANAFRDLQSAAATVFPAVKQFFTDLWATVGPILKQIWQVIVTQLIPAWAEFQKAIAPFVAFLISVLGPVVTFIFGQILTTIKGVLITITGIFQVFTGLLTGNWSKCWQGIKNIFKGIVAPMARIGTMIGTALRSLFSALGSWISNKWSQIKSWVTSKASAMMNGARNAVRSGVGKVRSAISAIKNAVTGFFRNAGSWLVGAGRAILNGLISGIRAAIGRVKSILSGVTNMIPDWKGPMSVDLKLLEPTGRAIMSGLTTGISNSLPDVRRTLQGVTNDIPSYAAPRGVAQTARRSAASPEIVVKSGGSRLDDALVEILRRSIANKGGDVQRVLGR